VSAAATDNLLARRRCRVGVLNYFWHFSCFARFCYKWLSQRKIKIDISRQQFVPGLQNLTLKNKFLKVLGLIVQNVTIFDLLVLTFTVPKL